MFMATSRRRSPSTMLAASMTFAIFRTSWSVSLRTRRAFGIPTFVMISLAFLGPIPWIYCSAIMTRLLVGMLTPAMRATAIHSYCRRKRSGQRSCLTRAVANDNATPSPFPRARYRSTSRLGCGLLMDSTAFRQPPRGRAFAHSRLAAGTLGPARFGGFGPHFRGPAGGFLRACSAAGPLLVLGRLTRWGLGRLLRRPLHRRLLAGRLAKHLIDGASHLRDRSHAIDRAQHALKLVIGGKRRGLIAVGQKPAVQHVRIVVVAQHLAPRLRLGDAFLNAFEQGTLVHLELDDGVELEALFLEHAIERVRLRHRARKTIEDKAPVRIGLLDARGDDRHHHVVGHEFAARHHLLGAHADRRAGLGRGTQHLTGRKLHQTMLGDEPLRLRAFAGPRRAEQYQPHLRRPRSFDRLISPSYWCASK